MKKILLYTSLAMLTLGGCNLDLETEGLSRITYFPEFLIEGGDFYLINEGASFTEPGIVVKEGEDEIPFTSTFIGRYSGYSGSSIGTAADQYFLTYSATNKDGFTSTANRTIVAVNTGDLVNSIEGVYNCTVTRVTGEAYTNLILIWKVGTDEYEISCSIGGFYGDGRAFGDGYLARGGTITVNNIATNDFSFTEALMESFGNHVIIDAMSVDAASKTITMHAGTNEFGNGSWDMVLVQIQP